MSGLPLNRIKLDAELIEARQLISLSLLSRGINEGAVDATFQRLLRDVKRVHGLNISEERMLKEIMGGLLSGKLKVSRSLP